MHLLRELTLGGFNGKPERKANVLVEALSRGSTKVFDYILSEGFSNIRAALKRNNQLEIENEVSQFNVQFYHKILGRGNLREFQGVYSRLVSIMQLGNFMELFSFWGKKTTVDPSTKAIFDFLLSDCAFKCLFATSLEF